MKEQSADNNKPGGRHVAIFRFSALGDVAMTVPVVYEVCRACPDVRFTFYTKKAVAPLFLYPPANLSVFPVDTHGRYRGLRVDVVADLHNVLRTRILGLFFMMAGARRAVLDKDRSAKRRLTAREKTSPLYPLPTSFDRYKKVFSRLGFETPDTFVSVFDNDHLPLPLPAGIEPRRPGEHWVGVAPFAKHEGKIYPLDRSEELVARLKRRPGSMTGRPAIRRSFRWRDNGWVLPWSSR